MSKSIEFLKRIFRIRNMMRALFVLVMILTGWAIFCLEERWRGERRWNEYRAKALANGAVLDLKNLIPPDVPNDQNFAAIPIIDDAFITQQEGRRDLKSFAAAKMDTAEFGFEPGKKGEPNLDLWRDHFVNNGVVPAGQGSAETVLAALSLVEPEMQQFREAAQRPKSKFPIQWDLGFAAHLPHLALLRQATKVFRLSLSAKLASNDSRAAYDDFRNSLGIYKALKAEPVIIHGLVRIANLRVIEGGIAEAGALASWSDSDLQKIAADLSTIDLVSDWQFSIKGERALMNWIFDDLHSKSDSELGSLLAALQIGGNGGNQMGVNFYPRGWFRFSQVKTNEHFDRMLDIANAVSRNDPMPEKIPEDPVFRRGKLAKLPYLLYLLAAPAVEGIGEKYANAISYHRQVQTACGLRRYFLKHGNYPATLNEIMPEYLGSVPHDPIDGATMRYRKNEDGGFQLWSVGLNRIDDGGKSEPQKSSREQPDWVLQVPGKS